jgi:hypothetical protein
LKRVDLKLAILGFLKFVLFDALMFVLYVKEHWAANQEYSKGNQRRTFSMLKASEKAIVLMFYSAVALTLVIYLERIIAHDVIFKVL